MRRRLSSSRLAAQHGFTTVVVMMGVLLGGLLLAGAYAATNGDTSVARKDQYYKQAYAAAEAGVNYYLSQLAQNSNFWSNCYTAPIQSPGTAFSTGSSTVITGSEGRFEIELLKPPNYSLACSATAPNSVIDPTTGQLTIRSTGSYRGVKRSIIATFKRQGFLNFLWFTDLETPDLLTYATAPPASAKCNDYYANGRQDPPCRDPSFITGDSMKGPMHTNDIFKICGSPSFGRTTNNNKDSIEATNPNGYRSACTGSAPQIHGVQTWGASYLQLPTSNASIKAYTDPNWIFTGPVHIDLNGTTATVKKWVSGTLTTIKTGTPPSGLIYVATGTCSATWTNQQAYTIVAGSTCGDAWVRSTGGTDDDVTADLTIAAENDIVVAGNTTHNSSSVIGLIANGFVRVYHPVVEPLTFDSYGNCTSANTTPTSGEGQGFAYLQDPKIEAAILALNHSWLVDNDDCGAPLGGLHITGAIAQKARGVVGHFNQTTQLATAGYLKDYNYDPALKYHQPPYFLDPVQASWDLFSQTEQVPAH
jgi:hypothetical protein